MRHLNDSEAALASSGDLSFVARVRSKAHCAVCPACRMRVEVFRQDAVRVRKIVPEFELPRSMDWGEMEREMFANVRLGLDVSEIRTDFGRANEPERAMSWTGAVAIAALTAIVITGWFLAGPRTQQYLLHAPKAVAQVKSGALILRGDENGVGFESRGVGMILRNVASPSSRFEVGLEGSVRSSVVDQDSGQVTVSQIYVE